MPQTYTGGKGVPRPRKGLSKPLTSTTSKHYRTESSQSRAHHSTANHNSNQNLSSSSSSNTQSKQYHSTNAQSRVEDRLAQLYQKKFKNNSSVSASSTPQSSLNKSNKVNRSRYNASTNSSSAASINTGNNDANKRRLQRRHTSISPPNELSNRQSHTYRNRKTSRSPPQTSKALRDITVPSTANANKHNSVKSDPLSSSNISIPLMKTNTRHRTATNALSSPSANQSSVANDDNNYYIRRGNNGSNRDGQSTTKVYRQKKRVTQSTNVTLVSSSNQKNNDNPVTASISNASIATDNGNCDNSIDNSIDHSSVPMSAAPSAHHVMTIQLKKQECDELNKANEKLTSENEEYQRELKELKQELSAKRQLLEDTQQSRREEGEILVATESRVSQLQRRLEQIGVNAVTLEKAAEMDEDTHDKIEFLIQRLNHAKNEQIVCNDRQSQMMANVKMKIEQIKSW